MPAVKINAAVLIRVAEWPPVFERAVYSVCCACISWAFVKFCMCRSFPFGIEGRTWGVIVLILDRCLSIYFMNAVLIAIICTPSEDT